MCGAPLHFCLFFKLFRLRALDQTIPKGPDFSVRLLHMRKPGKRGLLAHLYFSFSLPNFALKKGASEDAVMLESGIFLVSASIPSPSSHAKREQYKE